MNGLINTKLIWALSLLVLWLPFANLFAASDRFSPAEQLPCHQERLDPHDLHLAHSLNPELCDNCDCCKLVSAPMVVTDSRSLMFALTLADQTVPVQLEHLVTRPHNPPFRPPKTRFV